MQRYQWRGPVHASRVAKVLVLANRPAPVRLLSAGMVQLQCARHETTPHLADATSRRAISPIPWRRCSALWHKRAASTNAYRTWPRRLGNIVMMVHLRLFAPSPLSNALTAADLDRVRYSASLPGAAHPGWLSDLSWRHGEGKAQGLPGPPSYRSQAPVGGPRRKGGSLGRS